MNTALMTQGAPWRHIRMIPEAGSAMITVTVFLFAIFQIINFSMGSFFVCLILPIGRRVYELVLPFPKDKEQEAAIISKVQEVFAKRTEAKNLMRNVLLNVTPVHDYDDDSSFMTLV